jgi:hypothetical protein
MTFMTAAFELVRPLTPDQIKSLAGFANTYGIQRLHIDSTETILRLDYDASRLSRLVVEHVVSMSGAQILRQLPTPTDLTLARA